jgi:acyl-coenzyme A synthetase/AMP-(fatty) acid ligase
VSANPEQPASTAAAVVPVDAFPRDPRVLASLSPEERAAIYLNSIRKTFRLLLAVIAIGIVAAAIFAVVTIETIDSVGHDTCVNCITPQ